MRDPPLADSADAERISQATAVGHILGAAAELREADRLREVVGERHPVAREELGGGRTIETSTLWQAGADTNPGLHDHSMVWCLVGIGLLILNCRFWTKPPAHVDGPQSCWYPRMAQGCERQTQPRPAGR
jgi:hypothetical protein